MQPIKSNITSSSGKCINSVTSKCVIWDGPDITCLDGTTICKGQSIETTVYTLATKLCEIYDALKLNDLNTCINSISGGSDITPDSSVKEVFSVIIEKVCNINTRVEDLENMDTIVLTAVVPECLRSYTSPCFPNPITSLPNYDSVNNTLPIKDFAEASATLICCMQTDISSLQNNVSNINQQIADLWSALNACGNAIPAKVLPTCTYNFQTNPDGKPVTVQEAYTWLEADYCELSAKIGSTSQITTAVNAQCPNLGESDKLSSGGTMNNTSGWIDTPTTLAESLTNLWLTVCDTRTAVQQILDGCCFSLCSFLEFGYDIVFDSTNGDYFDVIFNDVNSNFTQYTDPRIPAGTPSPWPTILDPGAGQPLPGWINTSFSTASQTNVFITIDDGEGNVSVFDTGLTINDWIIESNATSNGFRIDFTTIPGYNKTSTNQTIAFSFTYSVDDGVTVKTCEIDQIDGLIYECCAPAVYPNNIEVYSDTGTDFYIRPYGVYEPTAPITGTASGPGAGTDTLEDSSATWAADQFNDPSGAFGQVVTLTHASGDIEYRYVIATTTTEVQVNLDWDSPVLAGDTFSIQNWYYPYPFDNVNYPQCVKNIQSVGVRIVSTETDGYDPNDPNTWTVVPYQNPELPLEDLFIGLANNQQLLTANSQYAVAFTTNYLCGSSDNILIPFVTPIQAIVSIETSSPGNFGGNPFQSINVEVDNITSNSDTLPDETATLTGPAAFPLFLPDPLNTTSFQIIPKPALWQTSVGGSQFCDCGLYKDPWGVTNGIPVRDTVLGTYRGYEVSIWKKNYSTNTYSPVTDQTSPIPKQYVTNTLVDPGLTFSAIPNTPLSPITINVPSTYSNNNIPIVARYDASGYEVNTSPLGQTVTCVGGPNNIRFSFAGQFGTSGDLDFSLRISVEVYKWDATANSGQGQYVSYSPAKSIVRTFTALIPRGSGGNVNISAAANFPLQTWTCSYGDALKIDIENLSLMATPSNFPYTPQCRDFSSDIRILPKSNSQYSCAGLSRIEIVTNDSSKLGGCTDLSPIGIFYSYKSIITEDFDVKLALSNDIEIYVH